MSCLHPRVDLAARGKRQELRTRLVRRETGPVAARGMRAVRWSREGVLVLHQCWRRYRGRVDGRSCASWRGGRGTLCWFVVGVRGMACLRLDGVYFVQGAIAIR